MKFNSYKEYREYIHEEWEDGYINELFCDELILEKKENLPYECASRTIEYRPLTEEEFNFKFLPQFSRHSIYVVQDVLNQILLEEDETLITESKVKQIRDLFEDLLKINNGGHQI
jgi:hypothetical protein